MVLLALEKRVGFEVISQGNAPSRIVSLLELYLKSLELIPELRTPITPLVA